MDNHKRDSYASSLFTDCKTDFNEQKIDFESIPPRFQDAVKANPFGVIAQTCTTEEIFHAFGFSVNDSCDIKSNTCCLGVTDTNDAKLNKIILNQGNEANKISNKKAKQNDLVFYGKKYKRTSKDICSDLDFEKKKPFEVKKWNISSDSDNISNNFGATDFDKHSHSFDEHNKFFDKCNYRHKDKSFSQYNSEKKRKQGSFNRWTRRNKNQTAGIYFEREKLHLKEQSTLDKSANIASSDVCKQSEVSTSDKLSLGNANLVSKVTNKVCTSKNSETVETLCNTENENRETPLKVKETPATHLLNEQKESSSKTHECKNENAHIKNSQKKFDSKKNQNDFRTNSKFYNSNNVTKKFDCKNMNTPTCANNEQQAVVSSELLSADSSRAQSKTSSIESFETKSNDKKFQNFANKNTTNVKSHKTENSHFSAYEQNSINFAEQNTKSLNTMFDDHDFSNSKVFYNSCSENHSTNKSLDKKFYNDVNYNKGEAYNSTVSQRVLRSRNQKNFKHKSNIQDYALRKCSEATNAIQSYSNQKKNLPYDNEEVSDSGFSESQNGFDDNILAVLKVIDNRQKNNEIHAEQSEQTDLFVEVSDKVQQIEFWTKLFCSTLGHENFTIQVDCEVTHTLRVTFLNTVEKSKALISLKKLKKTSQVPHIVRISSKTKSYRSADNIKNKILIDCSESIQERFNFCMSDHEKKILDLQAELGKINKKPNANMERSVLRDKISCLEKMKETFEYQKRIIQCKIKHFEQISNCKILEEVKHIKKIFSWECNFLKGSLPVFAYRENIIDLIKKNHVSVIVADTGSGKSTQIVQYLLQDDFLKGQIICTQPRKIAAISLARFVSGQIGSAVGELVGYEVGLLRKIGKHTRIVYMTDYTLLKKYCRNACFKEISCIIIDEAHERSLYTDLLLGAIKQHLKKSNLKVVITSATIDPNIFCEYFGIGRNSVLSVPGRAYPVDVIWQKTDAFIGCDYVEKCVEQAYRLHFQTNEGGILVFLTSPSETEEAIILFKSWLSEKKKPYSSGKLKAFLLTLHGRLDITEQSEVFKPVSSDSRKIIFATNSAETSITVPDIKYVVDSGMIKEKQRDPYKKQNMLVVSFVTRSSAEQRKGRAGRTEPGFCYRMYSKKNYEGMSEIPLPEILKIGLEQTVLEIIALSFDPETFDYVNAPSREGIINALNSLENIGAVKSKVITDLGRKILKLPLEPNLSKLVLRSIEESIGYEAIILASMVTVSSKIFIRTDENKDDADFKKIKFCDNRGDLFTFLKVFKAWNKVHKDAKDVWCTNCYISSKAMRTAYQLMNELFHILSQELNISVKKHFNDSIFFVNIGHLLLECFPDNICIFSGHEKAGYVSPCFTEPLFIHPSSSVCYLKNRMPSFLIYMTLLKTSRNFMLDVTPIEEHTVAKAERNGTFLYELEQLKKYHVAPKEIGPFGQVVLVRYILGKQGCKLQMLEKQIASLTKTNTFYIFVCREKSKLVIYIEKEHHSTVEKLVCKVIEEAQCNLNASEELYRFANYASCYIVMGTGGIIHDVIFPGEFREIVVESNKRYNVETINSLLSQYGKLQSVQLIGSSTISVTFEKVYCAQNAYNSLQELNVKAEQKVQFKSVEKFLPPYVITAVWYRLPCIGKGFIEFASETDCIEASFIFTSNSLCFQGKCITVTPVRNSEKLLEVKNLASSVNEHELKDFLSEYLPDYLEIEDIRLVRPKYKATEKDVNDARKQLLDFFSQYISSSEIFIELKTPLPNDALWQAHVHFENFEGGKKIMTSTNGKTKFGKSIVKLFPKLMSVIHCQSKVYEVIKSEVLRKLNEYKRLKVCSVFKIKHEKKVSITFHCKEFISLHVMVEEMKSLTQGHIIFCSEANKNMHLLLDSSQSFLKKVQNSTRTLITVDTVRNAVVIYGMKDACTRAKMDILCFAADSHTYVTKKFNLRDQNVPSGFIKALYKQYGFGLTGLINMFHLRDARINLRVYELSITGSEKSVEQVEEHLEAMCVKLFKSHLKPKQLEGSVAEEEMELCPVCFDAISLDFLRLENCGHAVCKPCAELYLESEIFPVVCIQKDCKKTLFVEDLQKIFLGNTLLKDKFYKAALKYFVMSNPSEVKYCPSPDCPFVYRVSSAYDKVQCVGCENEICIRCGVLYHHGMDCQLYQNIAADEDFSLKVWCKKDSANRKKCPSCSVTLEKNGGCNHMECANCKVHLCWLCLKTFPNSGNVYEHLPYCPFQKDSPGFTPV